MTGTRSHILGAMYSTRVASLEILFCSRRINLLKQIQKSGKAAPILHGGSTRLILLVLVCLIWIPRSDAGGVGLRGGPGACIATFFLSLKLAPPTLLPSTLIELIVCPLVCIFSATEALICKENLSWSVIVRKASTCIVVIAFD